MSTTRKVTSIAVHCSATPPSMDIGREEIDQWHKDRGWRGIGYHYVIRRNGDIEVGRPLDQVGSHVLGHNAESVGVCLVGGTTAEPKFAPEQNYTPEQYEALSSLLIGLSLRFPGVRVQGHRDYPGVKKACPCFDVGPWWANQKERYFDAILGDARG